MEDVIKKRNLFFAAIANLLVCGLGYIYVGHPWRLFIGVAVYILLETPFMLTNVVAQYPLCFYLLFLIPIAFYLFIIIDAARIAKKSNEYRLKSYNKWYVYLIYTILLYSFNELVLRNPNYIEFLRKGYTSYSIVTKNMEPALQLGDVVICNKKAYVDSLPQINDIIAVQIEEKNVIRRIKNIEGDKVTLIADNIHVESPVKVPEKMMFSDIVCKVSYISYSSDFDRIGNMVQ